MLNGVTNQVVSDFPHEGRLVALAKASNCLRRPALRRARSGAAIGNVVDGEGTGHDDRCARWQLAMRAAARLRAFGGQGLATFFFFLARSRPVGCSSNRSMPDARRYGSMAMPRAKAACSSSTTNLIVIVAFLASHVYECETIKEYAHSSQRRQDSFKRPAVRHGAGDRVGEQCDPAGRAAFTASLPPFRQLQGLSSFSISTRKRCAASSATGCCTPPWPRASDPKSSQRRICPLRKAAQPRSRPSKGGGRPDRFREGPAWRRSWDLPNAPVLCT